MTQINALRKIIREEVRAVFQQELAGILKEAVIANRQPSRTITEEVRKEQPIPRTLAKKAPAYVPPTLGAGNPLNSLLMETAQTMTREEMQAFAIEEAPAVTSIDEMVATAKRGGGIESIEINQVPDFTAMMSKMGIGGGV